MSSVISNFVPSSRSYLRVARTHFQINGREHTANFIDQRALECAAILQMDVVALGHGKARFRGPT